LVFLNYVINVKSLAIDLLKKMLAKDPTQRISAEQALQHVWLLQTDVLDSNTPFSPIYLSSAHENMKRFQEE